MKILNLLLKNTMIVRKQVLNMNTRKISKNTHEKILQAMDITKNMSIVRIIVEEAKTEQEILQKLKAEKLI